jgi:hypothetical protein
MALLARTSEKRVAVLLEKRAQKFCPEKRAGRRQIGNGGKLLAGPYMAGE